jgi:two-component system, NarL family, response regulator LiaR
MNPPIRILIVDDHALVREGLRVMLESDPELEVVAEASNGHEALLLVAAYEPRIVLMDISMPEMDGFEATRQIKHLHPEITILMLTMHRTESHLLQAIHAGASGYLLKESPRKEVLGTIKAASSSEVLISGNLLRLAARQDTPSPKLSLEPLTPREHQALSMIADGKTNKEIAQKLEISPETVKKMVQNVIAKLQASDRTHAAVLALRAGMI